jgi:tRNA pseudouridine13 synthase
VVPEAVVSRIANPLPQRFAATGQGTGGRIKVRPEDFLVDELPLYEPRGQGEHIYLRIEKSGVSHGEMMRCLERAFNVRESAIGFAGMKDKHGVTRQTVSIHRLEDPAAFDLGHERMRVLWAERHANKIRRGHLAGNRFSVRIREVDPMRVPVAQKALRELERRGVPNYFGFQRFGYRRNNHLLGAAWLAGEAQLVLDELLGSRGTAFPEYQRARRELYDAGRYAEAAALWTVSDRAELTAIHAIRRGRPPEEVVRAISPASRGFWVSALQSALFNRVLDRRIEEGLLDRLIEGDLAFRHDNRSVFAVTAAELERAELAARAAGLEVSPSGPLWGHGMLRAGGAVALREQEALEAAGVDPGLLLDRTRGPEGARRPLRVPLRNVELESGIDEHGGFIRLAFDLPRGAYATIVLREITRIDEETWEEE